MTSKDFDFDLMVTYPDPVTTGEVIRRLAGLHRVVLVSHTMTIDEVHDWLVRYAPETASRVVIRSVMEGVR